MYRVVLTLEEQIERARDGRSQMWIVNKMKEMGEVISEVQFTRKKKSSYPQDQFTESELKSLSTILNTDFTLDK